MLTPTHWLVHAALARLDRRRAEAVDEPPRIASRAFLWGAVAPDIPLTLLTAGAAVWYPATRGLTVGESFEHAFSTMFFTDPVWKAANSLFHAPLVVAGGALVSGLTRGWRDRWTWFLLGCTLHTAIDIPVHHDDGPLVLWPFDWDTRVVSPVSYWDPAHGGRWFQPLELTLAGGLAAWLWRGRRPIPRPDAPTRG